MKQRLCAVTEVACVEVNSEENLAGELPEPRAGLGTLSHPQTVTPTRYSCSQVPDQMPWAVLGTPIPSSTPFML